VLGDSRRAETTQFDMVRAFVFLAGLPFLPFRPGDRLDIVNVDYVADSITHLHQKERPAHDIYHLSSGTDSQTYRQLTDALARARKGRSPVFLPRMEKAFYTVVDRLSRRKGNVGFGASLMKVFFPYLTYDTVFDNSRVVAEMGRKPVPFSEYSYPLLHFSRQYRFTYPYREWPAEAPPRPASAEHVRTG
jgi:nucleoside-diphosphate-sugar epimerase